jgi:hypothetical protein
VLIALFCFKERFEERKKVLPSGAKHGFLKKLSSKRAAPKGTSLEVPYFVWDKPNPEGRTSFLFKNLSSSL